MGKKKMSLEVVNPDAGRVLTHSRQAIIYNLLYNSCL